MDNDGMSDMTVPIPSSRINEFGTDEEDSQEDTSNL
jgi:hypothetical protein